MNPYQVPAWSRRPRERISFALLSHFSQCRLRIRFATRIEAFENLHKESGSARMVT